MEGSPKHAKMAGNHAGQVETDLPSIKRLISLSFQITAMRRLIRLHNV